jgi:hypothetical protein
MPAFAGMTARKLCAPKSNGLSPAKWFHPENHFRAGSLPSTGSMH